MPRLLLPLTLTLLLLSACGDEPSCPSPLTPEGRCLCPSGLMPTPRMTSDAGYDCVPAEDASADADAASMGDADAAIPCDGACEERLCVEDACVACVEAGDCASTPDTPYCSTMNACVACLDSSQCSEAAAPLCDMNICAPCSEDAHCADITDDAGTGLNACLTGGEAPTCEAGAKRPAGEHEPRLQEWRQERQTGGRRWPLKQIARAKGGWHGLRGGMCFT